MSYLSHLDCPECAKVYSADELCTVCPECGSPLLARYDLPQARARLDRDAMTACSTDMLRVLNPPMASRISPLRMPAFSAGPSGTTETTTM